MKMDNTGLPRHYDAGVCRTRERMKIDLVAYREGN
jgi:hypothetical protein